MFFSVVYRSFPTSNHNAVRALYVSNELYIVRFLHQTTTYKAYAKSETGLYIVRFLHQTTTVFVLVASGFSLYIVRFLHQTTT